MSAPVPEAGNTSREEHNAFLYPGLEVMKACGHLGHTMLTAAFAPAIAAYEATEAAIEFAGGDSSALGFGRRALEATLEISEQVTAEHPKPEFGLRSTIIDGKEVPVRERITYETPHCQVINFERVFDNEADKRDDPNVLFVSAYSGHHASLHRDTLKAQLPNANTSIVAWKNPEEVPAEDGPFGVAEYIDQVRDIVVNAGPDTHVVAICQPTVEVLAALAVLAEEDPDKMPLSVTLIAGPIDVSKADGKVTDFVERYDLDTLRRTVIGKVPEGYPGAGRLVYPGDVQKMAFFMMNPEDHINAHVDQWWDRVLENDDKADKSAAFYREYFATFSLFGEFYVEHNENFFYDPKLANGTLTHHGKPVNLAAIKNLYILTVEGGTDDISPVGQTTAAHALCAGVPDGQKFHYEEPTAGHYGSFSGSKHRRNIAPRMRGLWRKAAAAKGIIYSEPTVDVIAPDSYSGA